jgi:hypothetical protein
MIIPSLKSTLTDLVLGIMPKSKSRGKKASAQGLGREDGRVDSRRGPFEEDYGNFSYPDFGDYEFGDAGYNSFARVQNPSVSARPSIHDAYEERGSRDIPAAFGQLQYGYGYPEGRGSFAYRGVNGGGSMGYDERRRFSAPIPNGDPYLGYQPQYREATSLPDILREVSVEDQIDELLEAVERTSLADSVHSGSLLDGVSVEVERQLVDMKAEKERAGGVADAVVECVALEDLPAVIQTIAIAREDARLGFEDEVGYGTEEIEDMAPMLVDLFQLAQVLAQEVL